MTLADECGGCRGLGAHRRWCPNVHGFIAAHWGHIEKQADAMASSLSGVGKYELANAAWAIAAEARTQAQAASDRYRGRQDAAATTDR